MARTGPVANWCTFATWASRQAGQTIRGEDLARALEAELGGAEEIAAAVTRVTEVLRAAGRVMDRHRVVAAIREVISPLKAAERSAAAVARGNTKVFEEIGREFARFLAVLDAGADPEALERFRAALRPGPPPDGQDLLGAAFAGAGRALRATDVRERGEQMLLANLRIGFHEQTRLQPEIAAALDAPVGDPRELAGRLRDRLLPPGAERLRPRVARRALDELLRRLVERARWRVRRIVTEHLMTLELPEGRLRLGRDLPGVCPPHLRDPVDPDLGDLLRRWDPAPDDTLGSGAEDWADLDDRMRFIAVLFRTRQDEPSLLGPPFPPPGRAAATV